jgi:hypothetical protein
MKLLSEVKLRRHGNMDLKEENAKLKKALAPLIIYSDMLRKRLFDENNGLHKIVQSDIANAKTLIVKEEG